MISPDCSELICPTEDVSVNPEFNSAWQAMATRPALDLLHFCGYQLPEVRGPRWCRENGDFTTKGWRVKSDFTTKNRVFFVIETEN